MQLSEFDKQNVGPILMGHGDWFSAHLMRLVAKADGFNKSQLRKVYPEHVAAVEEHLYGFPGGNEPLNF